MTITGQNGTIWKDSHFTLVFHIGDIGSLEGASIRWKMFDGDVLALEKSSEYPNEIHIEGNKVYVFIEPDDTLALYPEQYYHEIRATGVWGQTRPMSSGEITLRPALTQRFYSFLPYYGDANRQRQGEVEKFFDTERQLESVPMAGWTYNTGLDEFQSMCLAAGSLYVGGYDGTITKVNTNGTLAWTYSAWSGQMVGIWGIATNPTGTRVVSAHWSDERIRELTDGGSTGWSYTALGRVSHLRVNPTNGRYYFSDSKEFQDRQFRCLNSNGSHRWTLNTSAMYGVDHPGIDPTTGDAFVEEDRGQDFDPRFRIRRITASGSESWVINSSVDAVDHIAVDNDGTRFYVGGYTVSPTERRLVCHSTSNGNVHWNRVVSAAPRIIVSSPDGSRMYRGDHDGTITEFFADGTDGWFLNRRDSSIAGMAILSDRIYTMHQDGRLCETIMPAV